MAFLHVLPSSFTTILVHVHIVLPALQLDLQTRNVPSLNKFKVAIGPFTFI